MRILIVTQYFHPEEFRINDCAAELQRRGHEIVVLTGMPNYPAGTFFHGYGWFSPWTQQYQAVKVLRVPLLPRGQKQPWRLMLNYISFALLASIIGPWRCRGCFDAIFVYEPSPITVAVPAILLGWLKKAPILLWVQDLWPESLSATGAVKSRPALWLAARLVAWIYRHCDVILVQSRAFTSAVVGMGANPSKVHYLPNWAESLYVPYQPTPLDRKHLKIPEGFVLLFAGNIGAAQDFPTVLSAMERLRDLSVLHLVVLGDGRMAPWVRQEVKRRGLTQHVHLLGVYPMEQMPRFFANADAMLVTLKREPIFALTIPGKVQSYLACGRPIIAGLDGEGARVVTEANAGFVAAAEDTHALAQAIRRMVALPTSAREELGRNGRAYYEQHFDREKLITELEQLMEQI